MSATQRENYRGAALSELPLPGIVYLAAPYTSPDPQIREWRFKMATRAAAAIVAEGRVVFSPLTMTHPLDGLLAGNGKSLGSDYWLAFDYSFMQVCSEIRVLKLDGWESSSGIAREIAFFESHDRKVIFVEPDTISA